MADEMITGPDGIDYARCAKCGLPRIPHWRHPESRVATIGGGLLAFLAAVGIWTYVYYEDGLWPSDAWIWVSVVIFLSLATRLTARLGAWMVLPKGRWCLGHLSMGDVEKED